MSQKNKRRTVSAVMCVITKVNDDISVGQYATQFTEDI